MSDKGKPIIVTINGIDLSKHVIDISGLAFPEVTENPFDEGVKRLGPIEISGRWDDGTKRCVVCGGDFVPGPEGTLVVTVVETGERFTPVCHACGTSLMSPTD